ncbi:MAG: hypothetical protein EOO37_03010 [Cytophagaceae bacterium]|nr:MAG: hypothetical protein EOO37_03010 [Cytophagaceae bacterium]
MALAGLSPREHTSGTSIRGKVRITKMGSGTILGRLFICNQELVRSMAVRS